MNTKSLGAGQLLFKSFGAVAKRLPHGHPGQGRAVLSRVSDFGSLSAQVLDYIRLGVTYRIPGIMPMGRYIPMALPAQVVKVDM